MSYETQPGMYLHPTLAVTPTGVVLGVLDAWMWVRKPKNEPDVKESGRWVEGYEILADLAETIPDTRKVAGSPGDQRTDRSSEIYPAGDLGSSGSVGPANIVS